MFKSARHVDIRGVWRNARERIRLSRVQNRSVDSLALCNKIAVALCNTPPSHFVITSITLCNKLSQKIFLTSKVSSLSLLDSFPPPPPPPPTLKLTLTQTLNLTQGRVGTWQPCKDLSKSIRRPRAVVQSRSFDGGHRVGPHS